MHGWTYRQTQTDRWIEIHMHILIALNRYRDIA